MAEINALLMRIYSLLTTNRPMTTTPPPVTATIPVTMALPIIYAEGNRVKRQATCGDIYQAVTTPVANPDDATCTIERANMHVRNTDVNALTDGDLDNLDLSITELSDTEVYLTDATNNADYISYYGGENDPQFQAILDQLDLTAEAAEAKQEQADELIREYEQSQLPDDDGVGSNSTFVIIFSVIAGICTVLLISLLVMLILNYRQRGFWSWDPRPVAWSNSTRKDSFSSVGSAGIARLEEDIEQAKNVHYRYPYQPGMRPSDSLSKAFERGYGPIDRD